MVDAQDNANAPATGAVAAAAVVHKLLLRLPPLKWRSSGVWRRNRQSTPSAADRRSFPPTSDPKVCLYRFSLSHSSIYCTRDMIENKKGFGSSYPRLFMYTMVSEPGWSPQTLDPEPRKRGWNSVSNWKKLRRIDANRKRETTEKPIPENPNPNPKRQGGACLTWPFAHQLLLLWAPMVAVACERRKGRRGEK